MAATAVRVNIYEVDKKIMVTAPVPGMEPADIAIQVDGRRLMIWCDSTRESAADGAARQGSANMRITIPKKDPRSPRQAFERQSKLLRDAFVE